MNCAAVLADGILIQPLASPVRNFTTIIKQNTKTWCGQLY